MPSEISRQRAATEKEGQLLIGAKQQRLLELNA
jgi:hypothetical protein